jgi:ribosome-associated heat shock protein Hsp15
MGRRRRRATIFAVTETTTSPAPVRLDKWLWAARFYKTRALAAEEIGRGRVEVNGQLAKSSRAMRVGDRVRLRQGTVERIVDVRGVVGVRGPATAAQALYEETAASIADREARARQAKLAPEPALAVEHGRPSKRDRRQLADWQRWSVELEPDG